VVEGLYLTFVLQRVSSEKSFTILLVLYRPHSYLKRPIITNRVPEETPLHLRLIELLKYQKMNDEQFRRKLRQAFSQV
jgi:hypothetical protein